MKFYIIILIIVLLDQSIKYWVQKKLIKKRTYVIIKNVFNLTYVENTGAAFSIFRDKQIFLIRMTSMVLTFMFAMLFKAIDVGEIFIFKLSISLIVSGGIGNLIDRIRLHYVIDFFEIKKINFAVFNIADISVLIGIIIFSYCLLFMNDVIVMNI